MVWKAKTKMEQKVEFIHEWLTQKYTITELCRSFNISQPTAYKLIYRYEKIPKYDYPSTMKVMKVCQNGSMRWKSYYWVYLTAALKGKYVGAEDQGNGIWRVFYRDVFLGYFNEH